MPTAVTSPAGTRSSRLLSAAASVNATLVAGRAATLVGIQGHNARASAVYLKLYDKKTAPAETDTPVKTIYLPASTAFALSIPFRFKLGLGYRLTTAGADNSTAALTAGDILGLNVDYI